MNYNVPEILELFFDDKKIDQRIVVSDAMMWKSIQGFKKNIQNGKANC